MCEVKKVIEKFLSDEENSIRFEGNQKSSILNIENFLRVLNLYEKPDAYSIIDENVLIIEHFEFDSTFTNKKGSHNRKEQARIEREFENKLVNQQLKSGKTYIYTDKIKVNSTSKNYIKNVLGVFKSHYEKIDSYKENLLKNNIIKKSMNVKTMFWIEDTSILGNFYLKDLLNYDINITPIILLYCDEFLEELKKCNNLDYVMFFGNCGSEKMCWFLDLNYIEDYIQNQIKISEIEIIDFTPNVTEFVTLVDDKEVNK